MALLVRANAFQNGGTFANPNLLWYAKGVRAMQARALDDPASWWFFAAIHGEYVTKENSQPAFPGWGFIPPPPKVPTSPLPSNSVIDRFWNQCQHGSWHFPPWHRGYLFALEAQLRADIAEAGGPNDWTLPYWNYLGSGQQFDIPPAFTQANLPDGSANPLRVTNRFGPYGNGVIFAPTAAGVQQHPGHPLSRGLVKDDCMSNTLYTGVDANTPPPGFGGPVTGFSHDGGTFGNLESNPHNLVHVYIGGVLSNTNFGLMSDPGTAALDPIFYLHHANIDRMWEAWNTAGNANPTDPNWLNGPAASGEREFVMPMPGNPAWVYTPAQVSRTGQLNYTYDDLLPPAPPVNLLTQRLTRLGGVVAAAGAGSGGSAATGGNVELVGASEGPLRIGAAITDTMVRLDPEVRNKVSVSLSRAAETGAPDHVYLKLENVRGTLDASVLHVFVNLPQGSRPQDYPERMAGSAGLFGLRRASMRDGKHAGTGLNFIFDISGIVDSLHLSEGLQADSLRVTVMPDGVPPEGSEISVGRVSIYRLGA